MAQHFQRRIPLPHCLYMEKCSKKFRKKLFQNIKRKLNGKLFWEIVDWYSLNFFSFPTNRTPRNKRQADTGNEGSGEDDYDDDYYDNDEE